MTQLFRPTKETILVTGLNAMTQANEGKRMYAKKMRTEEEIQGHRDRCRDYHKKNKEEIAARKKVKYVENQAARQSDSRDWYHQNRGRVAKTKRKYYAENCESIKGKSRTYNKENKDMIHDRNSLNRVAINAIRRERTRNSPRTRLSNNMRTRLWRAITDQGGKKSDCTESLVGCSSGELRIYIESKFTGGMTWENYGLHGWHVDHIKPCTKFNLLLDSEQKLCFHYTNLQPLWAEDNLKKSAKYEHENII